MKKIRIGILTFHRAYNNGAFLQCFSLQHELRKRLTDADIEIIDYESKNMFNYYRTNIFNYFFGAYNSLNNFKVTQRLRHFASRIKYLFLFKPSFKQYFSNNKVKPNFDSVFNMLNLSKSKLISDDYDRVIQFIKSLEYDIIIVGSDAVWNDYQTSVPSVFYLDSSIDSIKYSYAASSYGMDYKNKTKNDLDSIASKIETFKFVGVRDMETENYMNYLSKQIKYEHVCDPTIFLDLKDLETIALNSLLDKIAKAGINIDKPIIGVMGNERIGKIARTIVGKDAQFVSLFENNKFCDYSLLNLTPIEWALCFRFFKCTFTSYFHGTIFSLKNGVPVFTIEQNYTYAAKYITKTRDLLNRLGLDDYYFSSNRQTNNEYSKQFAFISENDQAKRIELALEKEKASSELFFNDLLAAAKGVKK